MAVSTDCGCFVYGNTTAATHRVAADLIDCGIPLAQLNKRHFRTKSIRRLRLESAIIAGMELYDGDHRRGRPHPGHDGRRGGRRAGRGGHRRFVGQLEGVKTSVTIRELAPGKCKISLRTDPQDLNASTVCALLGAGATPPPPGPPWTCPWRRPGPPCWTPSTR
ncbi:MAG: hypothetical protein V8S34_01775 [Lawsonibacter sp.]